MDTSKNMDVAKYPVQIATLNACIDGDRRYTDTLTVVYHPKDDTCVIRVTETGAAGGMDGPGGTTSPHTSLLKRVAAVPGDVLAAVKEAINNKSYSFKRYGKPTKNLRWVGGGTGVSLGVIKDALKEVKGG